MTAHEEALAKLRADVEQAKAASVELAGALGTYFAALLEQGLRREEALMLVIAYQTSILRTAKDQGQEES